MAQQQAYHAYANTNKGTLVPGQTINVNKYTVEVERYLSQGGFAHVYLVRTPAPVYGTTHHVLKRIAVPNDTLLSEVKKEVDIMGILKGHPNIVYLIDATWNKMSNGTYEVFILMEFCSGGGIIDMMNRRLRERLTEAEILRIFVDVCEGVAAMHNLRPALLHRDLKVENILQASQTSFKLCDFGSAAPVAPRPPSTSAEIRALEADLSRHTTLQYRAPEMVDPYLRRPVDEKSDVWALGVLLFKLCYYTTPFEEHGPLAILNVQYHIPPYPVYSSQINALIGSMLREHGAQRPSVFEILAVGHKLRGTKSRFTYNIPAPQPLSPRLATSPPLNATASNSLNNVVTYKQPQTQPFQVPPEKNAGVQAREKVLEAIAPMRRGRPSASTAAVSSNSRPSSPQKETRAVEQKKETDWLDFDAEWRKKNAQSGVRGHKSGVVSSVDPWAMRTSAPGPGGSPDKAADAKKAAPRLDHGGFGDDFAEKLWDSFDNKLAASTTKPIPIPKLSSNTTSTTRLAPPGSKGKDAFEGLGLSSDRAPAPTLAEARKLRTGLNGTSGTPPSRPSSSRFTPSPRPVRTSPIPPTSTSSWKSNSTLLGDTAAESRFPSLEELDATFSSSPSPPVVQTNYTRSPHPPSLPPRPSATGGLGISGLRPPAQRQSTLGLDGVRSEQITGIAMRDTREDEGRRPGENGSGGTSTSAAANDISRTRVASALSPTISARPTLARKHRSTISIKPRQQPGGDIDLLSPEPVSPRTSSSPRPAPLNLTLNPPPDWLTGDDVSDQKPPGTPVLRESPSKRASLIEGSGVLAQAQEALAISVKAERQAPAYIVPESAAPEKVVTGGERVMRAPSPQPTGLARAKREASFFPPKPVVSRPLPTTQKDKVDKVTNVSESLTENWSPITQTFTPNVQNEPEPSSSDAEDSPEDVNGFVPSVVKHSVSRRKGKGRQSSVHDLVDLWGGGVSGAPKEKDNKDQSKDRDKDEEVTDPVRSLASAFTGTRSSIQKTRHPDMVGSASTTYRSMSPQEMPSPRLESQAPRPPLQTKPLHRKQPSVLNKPLVSVPSPVPASSVTRSRPQSMFLFPVSKSTSDVGPADRGAASPSLSPPSDPTPRATRTRRTSISDMVQRYEAIGNGKGPPTPAVVQKPTGIKVATQAASAASAVNSRMNTGTRAGSPLVSRRTGTSLPIPPDTTGILGDPSKQRTSPNGYRRSSPAKRPKEAVSHTTGLPRGPSPKPSFASPERSPERNVISFPTPRKPSPPPEEAVARSSSPERPYQGVGKLIDQWQRIGDSEASRGPAGKRGGFVAKRAGLVEGM